MNIWNLTIFDIIWHRFRYHLGYHLPSSIPFGMLLASLRHPWAPLGDQFVHPGPRTRETFKQSFFGVQFWTPVLTQQIVKTQIQFETVLSHLPQITCSACLRKTVILEVGGRSAAAQPGNRFVSFVSCVRASERRRTQVCHAENRKHMRTVALFFDLSVQRACCLFFDLDK